MYNSKYHQEVRAMPTDLQKKDELRRELRLLILVREDLEKLSDEFLSLRLVNERIEDIQKALED